eukprot:m.70026 g.70026  ORF g.70026 m.70026 type:complete len:545 (+) comp8620_c0_seq1:44-1678(+)
MLQATGCPPVGTILYVVSFGLCMVTVAPVTSAVRHNILLIVVDDLRPQTKAYGEDYMYTPNMDKLAHEGIMFTHAYVQQSICSPTRNSFLSGRYPDKTLSWNFLNHFREPGVGDNWTALPQFFKQHGYFTTGAGKVYHPNYPPNNDEPKSWSEPWLGQFGNCTCGGHGFPPGGRASCEGLSPSQGAQCDEDRVVEAVVGRLAMAVNGSLPSPWLIAAGFHKPHLPFYAPPNMYKLYPDSVTGQFPPVPLHTAVGMPNASFHSCLSNMPGKQNSNWGNFTDIPNTMTYRQPMDANAAARLRRGYWASVSYTDTNIGRVLDAVDAVRNSTVVVLLGDHGWSLGEGNLWCKMTNTENGVRVPLLFRPPGYTHGGTQVAQLAEAVDLYKTLADLSGLGAGLVEDGVDGVSLAPVINHPTHQPVASLRLASRSQFPRCFNQTIMAQYPSVLAPLDRTDCQDIPRQHFDLMGYSIRTAAWRYTEWRTWDGEMLQGRWDVDPVATELYAHGNDSTTVGFSSETVNVADTQAHAGVQRELSVLVRQLFTGHS